MYLFNYNASFLEYLFLEQEKTSTFTKFLSTKKHHNEQIYQQNRRIYKPIRCGNTIGFDDFA